MAMTLIVQKGVHRGKRIPITVSEFLIGRDPECHLRPSSKDVQWQHCAIVNRDGAAFLRDDSSPNGTYLNQRLLVGGEMQLDEGDLIEVGPLSFQVAFPPDSYAEIPEDFEDLSTRATPVPPTSVRPVVGGSSKVANKKAGSSVFHPVLTPKPMKDSQEMLCFN